MKKNKIKQPTPPSGYEFKGWATFNWGYCHNRVYRTRNEAIQDLIKDGISWKEQKDCMKIVKVKCIVL